MSRSAAVRKARSRARAKEAGYETVTLELSHEVMAALRATADMTGGSVKDHAQFLVRVTAARHLSETASLRDEARSLAAKLAELRPYARSLVKGGDQVVVKGRVYRFEDWQPLAANLGEIQARLARRGWSRARIERFCAPG
jgi:hypothetical protein